eukprot:COSAG03_NODE_1274_length_4421_cov_194.692272_3_plen_63_part_00
MAREPVLVRRTGVEQRDASDLEARHALQPCRVVRHTHTHTERERERERGRERERKRDSLGSP